MSASDFPDVINDKFHDLHDHKMEWVSSLKDKNQRDGWIDFYRKAFHTDEYQNVHCRLLEEMENK